MILPRRTSRRLALCGVVTSVLFATACSGPSSGDKPTEGEPTEGGEVVIALNTQPPSLDPYVTTATVTADVAYTVIEPLVAFDRDYNVHNVLAESVETDDHRTFTVHLREGVLFHDGEEMVAEDVVSSLARWAATHNTGLTYFSESTFTAVDDYTVEIEMPDVEYLTLEKLTSAFIYPKESNDAAAENGVPQDLYIGTGPYEFEEWKQDEYISVTKFDDYVSPAGEANGTSGERRGALDRIEFRIVTDETNRVNGLLTGEYDLVYAVSQDFQPQIESDPNLALETVDTAYQGIVYNKAAGPMTDVNLRQAVNAALDIDEIMLATYAEDTYLRNGSSALPSSPWYVDSAEDVYDLADLDMAKEYLEKSSYAGETLRFITTPDYPNFYNTAVVVEQILDEVGIDVEVVSSDWATMLATRAEKDQWDIFTTGFNYSFPAEQVWTLPTWPGWTDSPEMQQALEKISTSTSSDDAYAANEELAEAIAAYMPLSILGSNPATYGLSSKLGGFDVQFSPLAYNLYWTE